MKKCSDCETEMDDAVNFCPSCGVIQTTQSDVIIKGVKAQKITEWRCLICNYRGPMPTWIRGYFFPWLIIIFGICVGILPGLIAIAFFWGKRVCPRCKSRRAIISD